jgi:predicted Zn-dependent protease
MTIEEAVEIERRKIDYLENEIRLREQFVKVLKSVQQIAGERDVTVAEQTLKEADDDGTPETDLR